MIGMDSPQNVGANFSGYPFLFQFKISDSEEKILFSFSFFKFWPDILQKLYIMIIKRNIS